MTPISRKFKVADATLLEFTGKVIEYLHEDLVLFTDYDSELNDGTLADLQKLYKAALSFGTDQTQRAVIGILTEGLGAELKNCILIVRDVRYFALKVFSSSPATLKQFGFDNLQKVRKNKAKMVMFMYEMASVAEIYKAELMAGGLKETILNSIKPATVTLELTNISQEGGKKDRVVNTEDRVLLLNSIYDILAKFSRAAKIIFAGNKLKRKRYILPRTDNNGGKNDSSN